MKTILNLSISLLFIFLASCSISKIETASNEAKKDQKTLAEKRDYEVSIRENIARVSFIQTSGEESNNHIEFNFSGTSNVNPPRDFQFRGSNGEIENTPTFRGFRNVEFPFSGTVIYKVKPRLSKSNVSSGKQNSTASNSTQDVRCRLEFTINTAGNWTVNVAN